MASAPTLVAFQSEISPQNVLPMCPELEPPTQNSSLSGGPAPVDDAAWRTALPWLRRRKHPVQRRAPEWWQTTPHLRGSNRCVRRKWTEFDTLRAHLGR